MDTVQRGYEAARLRLKAMKAEEAPRPNRYNGRGFVKFKGHGDYVQGRLVELWQTAEDERDVLTVEVLDSGAPVETTDEDGKKTLVMDLEPGEHVYVPVNSADLKGRFEGRDGQNVHIEYVGDTPSKKGNAMKNFDVFFWHADDYDKQDELPLGAEGDDPPFKDKP